MSRILFFALSCLLAFQAHAQLQFEKGDRILLYGNSFVERLQEDGRFEASLQLANPDKKLEFRSLAWTGDEVGYRLRPERYVNHLKKLLAEWPANFVVLGFGMNESFRGDSGLDEFQGDLNGYLNEMQRRHPEAKVVLLSPIAVEKLPNPHYPDTGKHNAELRKYVDTMRVVAKERKVEFVDLFVPTLDAYAREREPLTDNGIHLNEFGYSIVSAHLSAKLLGESVHAKLAKKRVDEISRAVSRKAGFVATIVRPVNTVLYFGVRGRAREYNAEMPRYHALATKADAVTHAMCRDTSLAFDKSPLTLEPMIRREPVDLPSPKKMLEDFKVADGYEVNLFASEREFPELRNPEQIAFDERGRLWVVTMPSFPSTIPGDVPHDKIIVLEDTDRDGKADKSTVFADRLNVPDGLAFYKDGVIISHQPRLVFMKDTNGDGKADVRKEILRGIDVTDAHHGGMIAMGPMGNIMFCDGVFHRSQLETPHGVTRGVDATTYRFDLRKGSVEREYQTLTPNPWKITWDRWGNLFQMYGDGFVQDSHAIPWTPFGVYHPFKRAISIAYGKGSAAAVISSPNFPDEYQQGMASAVLLRKCFVSISKHRADGAYFKGSDRLDVLSSPDQLFRPVDIAFGLDGGMYVSDFCSRIIGHAQNSMRDPRWDPQCGRIWRITYKGKPVVNDWPKIEGAQTDELLELLKHPQDLVRDHARRKLRHIPGVVPVLDLWLDKNQKDESILEALWLMQDQGEVRQSLLSRLLKSKDFRLRAAATHLVRFQADQLENPQAILGKMAKDEHPRVRTEVIHVVSHLQRKDPAYASILGQVKVEGDKSLQTILQDASYGAYSGTGPEVPVMERPEAGKLAHWLLKEGESPERPFVFGSKTGSLGTMRTFVSSPAKKRAILSIKHSYVKVSLNGVPVISSANWWSSDWNVQVELQPGLNQIESKYVPGRGARGYAPVYLFNPLGNAFEDLEVSEDEASLKAMAKTYDKENGMSEGEIRILAVPNQLAFSPSEVRARAGQKLKVAFDNPDHQIHNLVLVRPGAENEVGLLADQMLQDPDAYAKGFVPDTAKVIWATPLVNANKKVTLDFTAPKEPGRYPFLCTFPGHWRVMKGVLVVY
jgi:glucose/arabinose dehydrogenase/lysophospholipase L1-like esterase/plastocyanin